MKLIVNPHKIILDKEETVNEKEINISKCTFEFADEITEEFVKEAYFTYKGNAYKKIIVNNECTFPQEVLQEEGTVEVGVVCYLVEDEEEITRYNPSPIWFKTDKGSLKEAQNSEEPTPSEMEQYEQALQDGLTLVNEKLEDVDSAITQANNLNIDANKVGTTTTVEITKKDGTTKTVNILDGVNGANGRDGSDGITPTIGDNGNWYLGSTDTGKPSRGEKGETGATGQTGQAGRDGVDGFSPNASVTKSGNVATITITDKVGTTTATISDGTNGQDGQDGVGVPTGGTQGQVLAKIDGTDYNTEWVTPSGGDDKTIFTIELEHGKCGEASSVDAQDYDKFLPLAQYLYEECTDFNTMRLTKAPIVYMYTSDTTSSDTQNYQLCRLSHSLISYGSTTYKFGMTSYTPIYGGNGYDQYLQITATITNGAITSISAISKNTVSKKTYIATTGANTISGLKTFSTLPQSTQTPSDTKDLTTKAYVDNAIASAITDALGGSY